MRAHLPLLAMSALLLLGGCDEAVATVPEGTPSSSPSPVARQPRPAAEAGGACVLLDYGLIDDALGVRFDVAASGKQGKTSTCVIRSSEAILPDLVLTVSPSTAEASVFVAEMAPSGGQAVKSLGKAAYRGTLKATKKTGPAIEVGWLTSDKRLLTLRLSFPPGMPLTAAEWQTTGLVVLAKKVEGLR